MSNNATSLLEGTAAPTVDEEVNILNYLDILCTVAFLICCLAVYLWHRNHIQEEIARIEDGDCNSTMYGQMSITEKEDAAIREAFLMFDTDDSGEIDEDELREAAKHLGIVMVDEDLHSAMLEMDADGSGEIDLGEFMEWFKQARAESPTSGKKPEGHKMSAMDKLKDAARHQVENAQSKVEKQSGVELSAKRLAHAWHVLPWYWLIAWVGGIMILVTLGFTVLIVIPGFFLISIICWTAVILRLNKDRLDTGSNIMDRDEEEGDADNPMFKAAVLGEKGAVISVDGVEAKEKSDYMLYQSADSGGDSGGPNSKSDDEQIDAEEDADNKHLGAE